VVALAANLVETRPTGAVVQRLLRTTAVDGTATVAAAVAATTVATVVAGGSGVALRRPGLTNQMAGDVTDQLDFQTTVEVVAVAATTVEGAAASTVEATVAVIVMNVGVIVAAAVTTVVVAVAATTVTTVVAEGSGVALRRPGLTNQMAGGVTAQLDSQTTVEVAAVAVMKGLKGEGVVVSIEEAIEVATDVARRRVQTNRVAGGVGRQSQTLVTRRVEQSTRAAHAEMTVAATNVAANVAADGAVVAAAAAAAVHGIVGKRFQLGKSDKNVPAQRFSWHRGLRLPAPLKAAAPTAQCLAVLHQSTRHQSWQRQRQKLGLESLPTKSLLK